MERKQRLIALALCEAAIFALGCWVGVMYPDAPHWVWLIIAIVSLFLAYIVWPKEAARTKLKLSSQYQEQPSVMQELLRDLLPKRMREGFAGFIAVFGVMAIIMMFVLFVKAQGLLIAYIEHLKSQLP